VIGELVGSYRVDALIGKGGMGEVYQATHTLIGKRVAVKVLRPEHSQLPDVVERFFREARAIAAISHPGTVDVYDTGRLDDGRAYIVMALLEGEDLRGRLDREPMPTELVRMVARQIAETLSVAHKKGIIHRDLKPDNVFLLPDAGERSGVRAKILDFGVAKLVDQAVSLKTKTVAILGSPPYMSPEQCRGAGFVDHRSDIYALGCLLFEMVTRRTPYVCRGFGEYLIAHCAEPVPNPRQYEPGIDPVLERIILKALSKKPEERQQSMDELLAELEHIGTEQQPDTPAELTTTMRSSAPIQLLPPPPEAPPAPGAAGAPTQKLAVALVLGGMLIAAIVAAVLLLR
jgi:serine/threonine-protein kinase